jgi:hypothetical protein
VLYIASVVLLGALALGTSSAGAANPPENIPLGAEPSSCSDETSLECQQWVLARLNSARASLGLSAYAVPASFTSLSADKQLLILSDLDRSAYGITPIYGLNTNLSEAAQAGVRERGDPRPPSAGGPWRGFGSDWASTGALIGYYLWMYDDGYKGPNADCTSPTAAGCWGHRRVILGEAVNLPNPQLLGAATGSAKRNAGTALIVSSNGGTSAYYTWAEAEAEGAGGEHQGGQVTVHVTIAGSGSVAVNDTSCAASCTVVVPGGSAITLKAKPSPKNRLTAWSGACSGRKHRCTPSVQGTEVTASASFAPKP